MAEQQEDRSTEDLLDEPSQTRIDDLREKGQVPQSREASGLLALIACASTLYVFAPTIGKDIAEYMKDVFRVDQTMKLNLTSNAALGDTMMKSLKLMIMIGLPISVAGFIFGVIGCFIQVGSIFTFEPIQPKFDKIDPLQGMKKFFTMKHFLDGIRIVAKVVIASSVTYGIVKSEVYLSPGQLLNEPSLMLGHFSRVGKTVFLSLITVFGIFAAVDFWMQKKDWLKQVRLTKQEAKEESKSKEGNPQVKARMRSIQRDMSRKRMMAAVKNADVIITNPTHIAIAIKYDTAKMLAPKVVAKGADFIAQKIKQIASESGIPMVENVPLARTLYKSVKLNQYIPRALYQAVAEVLAFVYRLKNRMSE
jgi:flagellar biosynthetic protein FlhB